MDSKSYKSAIRLLSLKDYSIHKLKTKLLDRNFPPKEVEEAIQLLIEKKYLKEEEYTKARVQYFLKRNYPAQAIIYRLRNEHLEVDQLFISDIMYELGIDAEQQALDFAQKKLRTSQHSKGNRDKLIRSLLQRGFSTDLAFKPVDRVLS